MCSCCTMQVFGDETRHWNFFDVYSSVLLLPDILLRKSSLASAFQRWVQTLAYRSDNWITRNSLRRRNLTKQSRKLNRWQRVLSFYQLYAKLQNRISVRESSEQARSFQKSSLKLFLSLDSKWPLSMTSISNIRTVWRWSVQQNGLHTLRTY